MKGERRKKDQNDKKTRKEGETKIKEETRRG
jgi:hypothetical protein